MTLDDAWKFIAVRGPSAVIVDRQGGQILPQDALKKNIQWDIIYIRDDGWSLAAPIYLAHYAENLHKSQWIGVMRRGDKKPKPKTFA